MIIHKEGYKIVFGLTAILLALNVTLSRFFPILTIFIALASFIIWFFVFWFFRNPKREVSTIQDEIIYAPADGRIVAIEEMEETEYFKDKRLQVSIFMSPYNVHVNRNPTSGKVNYYKYHQGKYMVASHPKSSTENERSTLVIENDNGEIMLRQVAGAIAKRIRTYLKVGEQIVQGNELGFIKFGSRVDLFLPLDAKVEVELEQKVKGNRTVIARL
ncbi:MAG: phosphatidylserine decarboxylase family protein [Bacteroidetes bacterium]|nr:MAG: phosphatidylserine decarboxylase family protein [Bacteroidota bacterium]